MPLSLAEVERRVVDKAPLASGAEIRFSDRYGFSINKHTKVDTQNKLMPFLKNFDEEMRVATFNAKIARIVGAQVAAKAELYYAGEPVDGRKGIKRFMK